MYLMIGCDAPRQYERSIGHSLMFSAWEQEEFAVQVARKELESALTDVLGQELATYTGTFLHLRPGERLDPVLM